MKKYIIPLLICAGMLASCAEKPAMDEVGSRGTQSLTVKVCFPTKAASAAPTISSVRLVAYDGAGQCSLNTKLTEGFTVTEETDGYVLSITEPFTLNLSSSTVYDVYAILNEGSYKLEGSDSYLSSLFDAISLGSKTQLAFNSYFNGRAHYETLAASAGEPEYLMGASQTITVHEGSSQTPCEVNFVTESTSLRRPYAQVTVNSIVSDESTAEVASIFVKKVTIENIPSGFAWGSEEGRLTASPARIDFAGEGANGFYPRTDNVSYTATYSNIKLSAEIDDRFYYVDKEYAFLDDMTSAKSYGNLPNDPPVDMDKNGLKKTYTALRLKFNTVAKKLTYDETSTISPSLWTLNLGNSYYVPECISSTPEDCMYIKVTVAIASPGMTDAALESYASSGVAEYFTNSNKIDSTFTADAAKNFFKNNVKHDSYKNEKGDTKYVYYLDNLSFEQNAPNNVNASGTGSEIVWRKVSDLYEFRIPVNNNVFDSDYSVRRNTKYTINLRVDSDTYDAMNATKGAVGPELGIRASVTKETICGYEE